MTKKPNTEKKASQFNEINRIIVSKLGFPSAYKKNGDTETTMIILNYYWLAVMYARTCKVTYITDDEEMAKKFNKEVTDSMIFGEGDQAILIDVNNWDNLQWWPVNENGEKMKFDVCIGNPPYKSGLHLKILEQTVKHADNVVFIHPAKWLEFPLRKRPTFLNGRIKNFTIINRSISNEIFGIDDGDMVITEVCKNNGGSFTGTPVEDPNYPCFKFNSRFV